MRAPSRRDDADGTAPSDAFVRAVSPVLGPGSPRELYTLLQRVARLPYEEAASPGFLLLHGIDAPRLWPAVGLETPIPLHDVRCFRKVLHVSSPTLPVLSDGRFAYGLGGCAATGNVLTVRFEWQGNWVLLQEGRILVRVTSFGEPDREPGLGEDRFTAAVHQVFGSLPSTASARLWELVGSATRQVRGTNVLISAGAPIEAARLNSQCLKVRPFALTPAVMEQITGIDGTVVMDVDGVCHAVGAILDGPVSVRGDRARGGRYNSALMYVDHAPFPSVIVVVSLDGMVDLVFREPGGRS